MFSQHLPNPDHDNFSIENTIEGRLQSTYLQLISYKSYI